MTGLLWLWKCCKSEWNYSRNLKLLWCVGANRGKWGPIRAQRGQWGPIRAQWGANTPKVPKFGIFGFFAETWDIFVFWDIFVILTLHMFITFSRIVSAPMFFFVYPKVYQKCELAERNNKQQVPPLIPVLKTHMCLLVTFRLTSLSSNPISRKKRR